MKKIFYKILLINCLVGFLSTNMSAQTIDSVSINRLLADANTGEYDDESLLQLEEAWRLSRQMSYTRGVKKALQSLIDHHRKNGRATEALRYCYQLNQLLLKTNNYTEIFENTVTIGNLYASEGINTKAIENFKLAEQYYGNATPFGQERYLKLMAQTYFKNKNYDEAGEQYQKLLRLKADVKPLQIEYLQQLVKCASAKKDYRKALTYNAELKLLIEQIGDEKEIAIIYNNIANNYLYLKEYDKALEYFSYAEKLCDKAKYLDVSVLYMNKGITYSNNNNFPKAIEYFTKAQKSVKSPNDRARIEHLLANIYLNNKDPYNAIRYNNTAMGEAKNTKDFYLLSETYNTAALAYQKVFDYESAFEYYKKYLIIKDSLLLVDLLKQQSLLQQQSNLEKAEKETKLLMSNQEIQALTIRQLEVEKERLSFESKALAADAARQDKEIALLKREEEIRTEKLHTSQLEAEKAQQALALANEQLLAAEKDKQIANLNKKEQAQQLALLEQKTTSQQQEDDKKREIQKLQSEKEFEAFQQASFRENTYRFGMIGGGLMLFTIAAFLYGRRINAKLKTQKAAIEESAIIIEAERAKADVLLHNILPDEAVAELKANGKATSKKYDFATVLFTDFVSFTSITETMSPELLIEMLNDCFLGFDQIIEKNKLEKIKTVGDSYMCVGGLPQANQTNPLDAVNAAVEMMDFMKSYNQNRIKNGTEPIEMRIGIHTGVVIAGVVGSKKFAYDVWGDTVNTASRIETASEPGKINITDKTYHLVKNKYNCTYRGEIEAKNKGKLGMYFVD